jgi:hypothetical protein
MDTKEIEAVLAEAGKVFRLSRLYPASHPGVQQAMAGLSAALPALAALGDVELRIRPTGLALDAAMVTTKNPQMQEFAGLLYAQGYRALALQAGATAEEFASLVRGAAGATARSGSALGATPRMPQLPHIQLERAASRKMPAGTPARPPRAMPAVVAEEGLGVRASGVFRPNALPTDIELNRLVTLLGFATPEGARGPLTRLEDVARALSEQRDFTGLAVAVAALVRWQGSEDAAAAEAARRTLAVAVTDATVVGMVGVAAGAQESDERRQVAADAIGALGPRALPSLLPLLRHNDATVRVAVIRALAKIGTPEALGAVEPLKQDADPGVRAAALAARR